MEVRPEHLQVQHVEEERRPVEVEVGEVRQAEEGVP